VSVETAKSRLLAGNTWPRAYVHYHYRPCAIPLSIATSV